MHSLGICFILWTNCGLIKVVEKIVVWLKCHLSLEQVFPTPLLSFTSLLPPPYWQLLLQIKIFNSSAPPAQQRRDAEVPSDDEEDLVDWVGLLLLLVETPLLLLSPSSSILEAPFSVAKVWRHIMGYFCCWLCWPFRASVIQKLPHCYLKVANVNFFTCTATERRWSPLRCRGRGGRLGRLSPLIIGSPLNIDGDSGGWLPLIRDGEGDGGQLRNSLRPANED